MASSKSIRGYVLINCLYSPAFVINFTELAFFTLLKKMCYIFMSNKNVLFGSFFRFYEFLSTGISDALNINSLNDCYTYMYKYMHATHQYIFEKINVKFGKRL